MGRGLSDLQKRILVYAWNEVKADPDSRVNGATAYVSWFDHFHPDCKAAIEEELLPGKWGKWTHNDIASVSRALRRLEERGLIARLRGSNQQRTTGIVLTPEGARVAASLAAGDSGRTAIALARHLAKHPE
jgi:hypothetical protein